MTPYRRPQILPMFLVSLPFANTVKMFVVVGLKRRQVSGNKERKRQQEEVTRLRNAAFALGSFKMNASSKTFYEAGCSQSGCSRVTSSDGHLWWSICGSFHLTNLRTMVCFWFMAPLLRSYQHTSSSPSLYTTHSLKWTLFSSTRHSCLFSHAYTFFNCNPTPTSLCTVLRNNPPVYPLSPFVYSWICIFGYLRKAL